MQLSEKKEAIFNSTLALIKEHGFHGTPMSLVAKNAGVAAGTIYHYFESKDQLICELYEYNKSRLERIIDEALSDTELNCKETYFRICQRLYHYYTESPNVLIFFEQFLNSPYHKSKTEMSKEGRLYIFFKDCIKKGFIKQVKPEILIVLVLGNIATLAKLYNFGNQNLSKTELQQVLQIMWDGISVKS